MEAEITVNYPTANLNPQENAKWKEIENAVGKLSADLNLGKYHPQMKGAKALASEEIIGDTRYIVIGFDSTDVRIYIVAKIFLNSSESKLMNIIEKEIREKLGA